MSWGLIALNGSITSKTQLVEQMLRVTSSQPFDFVIGVDGGCKLLEILGFNPNLILGDFDSIENLERYRTKWPASEIKRFPPEKDFTDAELAFEEISHLAIDKIIVIGGFGGRADHMISIMHLLMKADNCIMVDEQNILEKIQSPFYRKLNQADYEGVYISLVPLLENFENITLKGFKYPLNEATITFSQTIGISNEIVEEVASIEVLKGSGYLVTSRDRY